MVLVKHRDKISGRLSTGDGSPVVGPMGTMHSHLPIVDPSKGTLLQVTSMTGDCEQGAKPRIALIISGLAGLAIAAFALLVWLVNPFRVPGELDVLDQVSLGDGNVLLLAQRYNGSIAEPSTITVYQELPGKVWVAYYVDHESSYWRSGRIQASGDEDGRYIVWRGNKAVALIDSGSHEARSLEDTQLVRKASLLDQNPLDDPKRRPQSRGQFKP